MNILEIKNLNKSFNNLKILDISLHVKRGEIVSIIGKSGVGKTTLFNLITKFDDFDFGEILVNNDKQYIPKDSLSYLTQENSLLRFNTAIENIIIPLVLKGYTKENALNIARDLLKQFNLSYLENRYPSKLSGGEKQKIAFLQVLILSNELILLDEPFSSLDYLNKQELNNWFLQIKEKLNFSSLIITHDIDQAIKLSNRIYILKKENDITSISEEIIVNDTLTSEDILKKLI